MRTTSTPAAAIPATALSACTGSESSSRSSSIPISRFEAAAAEATGPTATSRSAQARTARTRRAGHRGATCASREVSAPHCRRQTPARFGTRTRNWPLRERTVSVVTVVNGPPLGGRFWIWTTCGVESGAGRTCP